MQCHSGYEGSLDFDMGPSVYQQARGISSAELTFPAFCSLLAWLFWFLKMHLFWPGPNNVSGHSYSLHVAS